MIIDVLFIILVGLLILVNMLFRSVVKTTKEIPNGTGLSGAEIARKVTALFCEEDPHIIKKSGKYLDHYNKERNTIKLSPDVFDGENVYAATTAINIALETDPTKKQVPIYRRLNSYLVLISYIIIFIGAFLNNSFTLRFGLFLVILSFIIEVILMVALFQTEVEFKEKMEKIAKEEVIRPADEYENNFLLLAISRLATFPYNFINYFR